MKTFLPDLWHDLREKRLWPVAAVLALALLAVPVVLSKPAEEAPAPPIAAEREAPEPEELKGLASVRLDESAEGTGSPLDTFDPSNPFRPPSAVVERGREQSADETAAGPGSAADSPADSATAGSGGGVTDDGAGGGSGPTTGGDGDGDDGDDGGGGKETTTQFAYVIDVTFRRNERTRRIKGMQRLEMLPNESQPLLLFLGVEPGGGNAVFLVDSTLQAAGEGSCRPSGKNCAFLHLGPGSEHEFHNEGGDSFLLRIDEIRKVKVGARNARKASRKSARAAVGEPRRFASPLISDLVSVSSEDAPTSNDDTNRR